MSKVSKVRVIGSEALYIFRNKHICSKCYFNWISLRKLFLHETNILSQIPFCEIQNQVSQVSQLFWHYFDSIVQDQLESVDIFLISTYN